MKYIGIALLIVASSVTTQAEVHPKLAAALPKMVGKSQEELKKSYADVLAKFGGSEDVVFLKPTPWYVWHFKNAKKEDRYVIFSGQPDF